MTRPHSSTRPITSANNFPAIICAWTSERKPNASEKKLREADKFDLQRYITCCYGSLTAFNILFKNKDDQFRTNAVNRSNG
jgi:hypothetical protein